MVHEKSEHVSWRKLETGRSILLDLRSGHYYTLNETATTIWEGLTSGASPEDVTERVQRMFEADVPIVAADVRTLTELLLEKGFLRRTARSVHEPAEQTDEMEVSSEPYVAPMMEEHEAIEQITASGSGGDYYDGYSYHYWYPN